MTPQPWLFVRHGQSTANAERWYAGHRDAPLTDLGRKQARQARARLADQPFVRALTSDLSRAHETAQIVLAEREVPLSVHPELRERSLGAFEGRGVDALLASGERTSLLGWSTAPPAGESPLDLTRRLLTFLATVPPVDGATLVVGHGLMIKCLLRAIDDGDREQLTLQPFGNAEVARRDLPADAWARLLSELT